jgi:hypothetical protein
MPAPGAATDKKDEGKKEDMKEGEAPADDKKADAAPADPAKTDAPADGDKKPEEK